MTTGRIQASQTEEKVYDAARRYVAAGFSIIPIRADRSKAPAIQWNSYRRRLPGEDELAQWFDQMRVGLAVVAGPISGGGLATGGLEILDFDSIMASAEFGRLIEGLDIEAIVRSMPISRTPTGGRHLFYRCPEIAGNQKLAMDLVAGPDGKMVPKVLVETRGDGGYAVIPPTPARCHPKNEPYRWIQGDLTTTPTITPEDRQVLLGIVRSLTRYVPPEAVLRGPSGNGCGYAQRHGNGTGPNGQTRPGTFSGPRPGDDYNARCDLGELLEHHGWRRESTRGEIQHWARPGKQRGSSASILPGSTPVFYCFSSNAHPFEMDRGYTAFAAYCLLEHDGDFAAAAKELSRQGFGDQTPRYLGPEPPAAVAEAEPPDPPEDADQVDLGGDDGEGGPEGGEPDGQTGDSPGITLISPDGEAAGEAPEESGDGYGKGPGGPSDHELMLSWLKTAQGSFGFFEGDQWWRYKAGVWKFCNPSHVETDIQAFLEHLKRNGASRLTIKHGRNVEICYQSRLHLGIKSLDILDAHPSWVPLRNGIYDTDTGLMIDHSWRHYLTTQSRFDYDPDAQCPRWDAFIHETMLNSAGEYCPEWAEAIQEWFGYCMVPDNRAQVAMVWLGEGQNGKGVATRVMQKLVPSWTEVPIENLDSEYYRAALKGKLVGFVNEPNPRSLQKNGAHFKAITGQDPISARHPHGMVFTFTPYARITISCNAVPGTRDLSRGYFRRMLMIDWRLNVTREQRDLDLDQQLETELPGIFNWAMEGLRRFRARGSQFANLPESDALLQEYRYSQDTVSQFVEDECIKAPDGRASFSALYEAYVTWCGRSGIRHFANRDAFGKRLTQLGFGVLIAKPDGKCGPSVRCRAGLKLASSGGGLFGSRAGRQALFDSDPEGHPGADLGAPP